MKRAYDDVLARALRLDPQARAEVVAELLASLDGPADQDAAEAWEVEIRRRVQALEAGELALEPWDDVRQRIERARRRG